MEKEKVNEKELDKVNGGMFVVEDEVEKHEDLSDKKVENAVTDNAYYR